MEKIILTNKLEYSASQKDNPMKTVAEIKAGRFEIVL
jgi:hypothetical protein